MDIKQANNIEAFILAGGRSRRMGQDKGLMQLGNKPMVRYTLEELEKLHLPVSIISGRAEYAAYGHSVFADIVEGRGPMGGLYTAMMRSRADQVLLLSCDAPGISAQALRHLLSKAENELITVAGFDKKINPLFAIYPLSMLNEVKNRMDAGKLRMHEFIEAQPHKIVDLSWMEQECNALSLNINTPEDIQLFLKAWKKTG
ncbi:MAG: molybdenum cofactor guanylyltransferase [Cyclobacteriaceae bacterium]|nr:molybdenum cofactor guanylyltransferase [Cyclobacteriaceae bacterium]